MFDKFISPHQWMYQNVLSNIKQYILKNILTTNVFKTKPIFRSSSDVIGLGATHHNHHLHGYDAPFRIYLCANITTVNVMVYCKIMNINYFQPMLEPVFQWMCLVVVGFYFCQSVHQQLCLAVDLTKNGRVYAIYCVKSWSHLCSPHRLHLKFVCVIL